MKCRIKPARSMRQRRGKYLNDTASDARHWTEKVQKSYRLRPPTDKKKPGRKTGLSACIASPVMPPGSPRKNSDPSKQCHLVDTIEDRELSALWLRLASHLLKEVRQRRRHRQGLPTAPYLLYSDCEIGFSVVTNGGMATVLPAREPDVSRRHLSSPPRVTRYQIPAIPHPLRGTRQAQPATAACHA